MTSNDLQVRYHAVCQAIETACRAAQRPIDSVRLLAVSKTKPAEDIARLADLGVREFGENYLQEALDKQAELRDRDLIWHFIGHIQSNKTREIAQNFDWVHTVDRRKIVQRLNDARAHCATPLNVLIQVNVDDAPTKSGVAPTDLTGLVEEVMNSPHLQLRGLMSIPDPVSEEALIASHQLLASLLATLKHRFPQAMLDTLSMGMTQDLAPAIAAGSTCVRIGTALFGQRTPRSER